MRLILLTGIPWTGRLFWLVAYKLGMLLIKNEMFWFKQDKCVHQVYINYCFAEGRLTCSFPNIVRNHKLAEAILFSVQPHNTCLKRTQVHSTCIYVYNVYLGYLSHELTLLDGSLSGWCVPRNKVWWPHLQQSLLWTWHSDGWVHDSWQLLWIVIEWFTALNKLQI